MLISTKKILKKKRWNKLHYGDKKFSHDDIFAQH